MLVTTMNAVRAKLSALRVAAAATHPLASGAVKRFQHAEAAEATTDALQEFRETVRDFAQRAIAPHASEIDRQNNFPSSTNLWKDIGDFGLHGLTAPADYGGLDVGYQHHCVAMEEISRASGSVGLSYGAHSNLCINQLVRNANQQQKQKYLPNLVADDHVGALAMSEPGSGSDVVSMRCRADKQDGCFVLNGTKMWCTNGTVANTLVVYARTEQDKGPHGITAFIIEKGMKGLDMMQGMRLCNCKKAAKARWSQQPTITELTA